MWSSINTPWARRSLSPALGVVLWLAAAMALPALAQDSALSPPQVITAGSGLSLDYSGNQSATFYLVGPGQVVKRQAQPGKAIAVSPEETSGAGRYLAIVCASSCQSSVFWVVPAAPATLNFLVHPSRAAVRLPDVVSGTALAFDKFGNFVLKPAAVEFRMTAEGAPLLTRSETTRDGMAWFRAASGSHAGAVQLQASMGDVSTRRVVQQVASDPCNLRVSAQPGSHGVVLETAPVRDCAGNPVPDGTIVTFTVSDAAGQSTVDAPIKQGIARAQVPVSGPATVDVASGLVVGNELHLGGQR